ncbi:3D-(3,5/4)-trihydroxycyclohexane-1,2-dione acylhydrolase (decyclizing) [Glycomyces tarimensis]
MPAETIRLTVAQALVRFLAEQWTERDGETRRLIAGTFGIFGHGNVAGLGQALLQADEDGVDMPYLLARNEQAMVHASSAYAKLSDRLATYACTASIGPGSTNMVTGAALATVNRLPVLLLPGDIFANRAPDPVLQQIEDPRALDVSVNDAFRPVSKFFDRISRPEQLLPSALAAMRVLTDPVETGAVVIALPQDVQAEAWDWPVDFFRRRTWRIRRPAPDPAELDAAIGAIRSARRPLIVAGGGVVYSHATERLRAFAAAHGVPVAETHAGRGSVPWDHPQAVGALGSTGSRAANELARDADVVIGVGTRYTDFTTASHTVFGDPDVAFVNLNVAPMDAAKHAAATLVADARTGIEALGDGLADWRADPAWTRRASNLAADWQTVVERARHPHGEARGAANAQRREPLPAQTEILGALNDAMGERDVVINAAGSMPGDLQMMWRSSDPKQYHVEYGYSCMGYEVAAGIGCKLADPGREIVVLVGDGSYLMLSSEITTAIAEHLKIIVVIVQNHGFASIGALSESLGSRRFGTEYRYRDPQSGRLDGDVLPVDLAANAASLGAHVLSARTVAEFKDAIERAKAADRTTVVHVETDLHSPGLPQSAWWDVPVAETATLDSTRAAREAYESGKRGQRHYL